MMIKSLFQIILWLGLTSLVHAVEFPSSDNPGEFDQEVKEYALSLLKGRDIHVRENPEIRKAIEEDPRNWEAALSEIIGSPEHYNKAETEVALMLAIMRGKGNDPRIGAATIQLFQKMLQISIERLDKVTDNQRVIVATKGRIGSLIAQMVQTDSPDVLQAVLEYFNSPEADRLGTLETVTPQYIAPALQKYGDPRNAKEALKVAEKLESIGRTDFVGDIRRSAERIEKDAARKDATAGNLRENGPKNAPAANDQNKDASADTLFWPWLAAVAALVTALVAYFRMKKS